MQYITGACQELLMLPWLVDLETDPMESYNLYDYQLHQQERLKE